MILIPLLVCRQILLVNHSHSLSLVAIFRTTDQADQSYRIVKTWWAEAYRLNSMSRGCGVTGCNLCRPQNFWYIVFPFTYEAVNLLDWFGKVINFCCVVYSWLKMRFCEKDTNFLQNHHLRFFLCSNGQIYGRDFAKFCGLLRIYELYNTNTFLHAYRKMYFCSLCT